MCINQKVRSKKYKKYFYCTLQKKEISFDKCKECSNKEYRKAKPIKVSEVKIKKKSAKLAKLEKQRDKGIIKSGTCDYCQREFKHLDSHEIYGGSNRKRSILNGFVKKLCRECHSNEEIVKQLRIDTQKEFEETHTREEFIALIGKSHL